MHSFLGGRPISRPADKTTASSGLRALAAALGKTVKRPLRHLRFVGSAQYWEKRYKAGGNAGAGSFGRLAMYKAVFLNDLVVRLNIESVGEFGCGDGHQLVLSRYSNYTGFDVSNTAIEMATARLADRHHYRFRHIREFVSCDRFDLTLSLDVLYHLVEDEVFDDYMVKLFDAARRFVVIYSIDSNSSSNDPHVRHRRFSNWVTRHRPMFERLLHEPNPYPFDASDPANTSFAEFHVYRRRPDSVHPVTVAPADDGRSSA